MKRLISLSLSLVLIAAFLGMSGCVQSDSPLSNLQSTIEQSDSSNDNPPPPPPPKRDGKQEKSFGAVKAMYSGDKRNG